MTRRYSPEFNPFTSTRTKLVELVEAGGKVYRVYSHTSRRVSGNFIVAIDEHNWAAFDTIEQARSAARKELAWP